MKPLQEWLRRPGGLAEQLRSLREAAGLTQDELASRLGWPPSKLSKLENGWQMPSAADIASLVQAADRMGEASALQAMRAEGQAVHDEWKRRYRSGGPPAVQQDYDAFVRSGTIIRDFEMFTIPGIIQTPGYATVRAEEVVSLLGADPAQVEESVRAKMRRQSVLYEPGKTFHIVITQAALDYFLAPPDIMIGQIDRLAGLIGMANITLGIIPRGATLPITPLTGFLMVDDVTVIETFTGSDTLTGDESAKYAEIFDALMATAVTGAAARRVLTAAATQISTAEI